MEYAPLPTPDELTRLSSVLGFDLTWERRVEGGLGCTTDKLAGNGQQLVLRRHGPWWIDRNPRVAIKERAVLELLGSQNLPVPRPLWAEESGVFRGPSIVLEWVEGDDLLVPADPLEASRKLAVTLAAIHAVEPDRDTSNLLMAQTSMDGERPEGYSDHPLASAVDAKLNTLEPAHRGTTIVHSDYWPGNTIWRNGDLAAVIDWEEAMLGDPMNDVAYCALDLRYLGLDHAADHFIDEYRRVSGHSLGTLEYWTLFALSRPMPDIAHWLPAWEARGITHIGAEELRARHRGLLEEALG